MREVWWLVTQEHPDKKFINKNNFILKINGIKKILNTQKIKIIIRKEFTENKKSYINLKKIIQKYKKINFVWLMGAVNLYNYMMGASYVIIIVSVITPFIIGIGIPLTCIIALLTFSLTPKGNFRTASKILGKDYEKIMELIPAMGNTVMTTLQTSILLLIGYIIWWTLSMYFPGTISLVPIASPVA